MKEGTGTNSWVAPHLFCGLGNRLFQVMAAAGLAERSQRRLVFFLPRMTKGEHGCWKLFLDFFPDVPIVETASEWSVLEDVSGSSLPEGPIVTHGFFQEVALFPDDFRPRLPLALRPQQMTNAWAIHFRIGDYKILPHHQMPLAAYYRQTIEANCSKTSPLTLFSDSPEALPSIQKELQSLGWSQVTISAAKDERETIQEFCVCGGGSIGSNSTFSWWLAWFAHVEKEKYRAFFPSPWLKGQSAPKIFNLPFTQAVEISELPSEPQLHSFPFK